MEFVKLGLFLGGFHSLVSGPVGGARVVHRHSGDGVATAAKEESLGSPTWNKARCAQRKSKDGIEKNVVGRRLELTFFPSRLYNQAQPQVNAI